MTRDLIHREFVRTLRKLAELEGLLMSAPRKKLEELMADSVEPGSTKADVIRLLQKEPERVFRTVEIAHETRRAFHAVRTALLRLQKTGLVVKQGPALFQAAKEMSMSRVSTQPSINPTTVKGRALDLINKHPKGITTDAITASLKCTANAVHQAIYELKADKFIILMARGLYRPVTEQDETEGANY